MAQKHDCVAIQFVDPAERQLEVVVVGDLPDDREPQARTGRIARAGFVRSGVSVSDPADSVTTTAGQLTVQLDGGARTGDDGRVGSGNGGRTR